VRKVASRAIRVQPGDEVVVRAALPFNVGLARLYVWAKQKGCDQFSPYVLGADTIPINGFPTMLSPLSMRLVEARPIHKISFTSDIKGQIVIVQEVDSLSDKPARIDIELYMTTTSPLGRFKRRLTEWPQRVKL